MFLTSHDAGDIEHVAQRVIVINHGRVVTDNSVAAVRRQYLSSRILRIQFQEQAGCFDLPGARLIQKSGYELKLELDTSITPIPQAIETIFKAAPVADISVEDPPLEEVIARIYMGHRETLIKRGGSS